MRFGIKDAFTVFVILVLVAAVVIASEWTLRASIIVLVLGSVGAVLATAQLLVDCLGRARAEGRPKPKLAYELPSFEEPDPGAVARGSLEIWAWLIGLVAGIYVVGLPLALTLFVFSYVVSYGGSWKAGAILAGLIAAFVFGVYENIMHVYWPDSLLKSLFPAWPY